MNDDQDDGLALLAHCVQFTAVHGRYRLRELLAAVHVAVSPAGCRPIVRAAYEETGIDMSGVPDIEIEEVPVQ